MNSQWRWKVFCVPLFTTLGIFWLFVARIGEKELNFNGTMRYVVWMSSVTTRHTCFRFRIATVTPVLSQLFIRCVLHLLWFYDQNKWSKMQFKSLSEKLHHDIHSHYAKVLLLFWCWFRFFLCSFLLRARKTQLTHSKASWLPFCLFVARFYPGKAHTHTHTHKMASK